MAKLEDHADLSYKAEFSAGTINYLKSQPRDWRIGVSFGQQLLLFGDASVDSSRLVPYKKIIDTTIPIPLQSVFIRINPRFYYAGIILARQRAGFNLMVGFKEGIMKIISRKTHGYLDYLVGALLIAAPWLFNFYEGGMESWIPIILGAGTIVYSLITDYESGLTGIIPMRIHLIMDMLSGVLLAASPWIFGFADLVFWPHLVVGIIEIVVPLLTNPGSQYIGKASDLEKL